METMEKLKEQHGANAIGQVIRILDKHTVVVNLGKRKLKIGDILQIYEYLGTLKGPNGEDYGAFEYVKAEVEVIRCEPQYSICKTQFTTTETIGMALSPLLERPIRHREVLSVDTDDIEPIQPKEQKVRIGDPVKYA